MCRVRPRIVRIRIGPLTGLRESYVGTVQATSLYGLHPPGACFVLRCREPLLLATLEPGEDRVRNVPRARIGHQLGRQRDPGPAPPVRRLRRTDSGRSALTCSPCFASRLRMSRSMRRRTCPPAPTTNPHRRVHLALDPVSGTDVAAAWRLPRAQRGRTRAYPQPQTAASGPPRASNRYVLLAHNMQHENCARLIPPIAMALLQYSYCRCDQFFK
jgi:hypothetical protein